MCNYASERPAVDCIVWLGLAWLAYVASSDALHDNRKYAVRTPCAVHGMSGTLQMKNTLTRQKAANAPNPNHRAKLRKGRALLKDKSGRAPV
jgi:hypothetical protein